MAFNISGSISDMAKKLNSQNAMGSEEAKQQVAETTDPSQMHGLKGMMARAKEGSLFGDKENTTSKSADGDKENTKIEIPQVDTSFNPQLKSSSLGSDAHLKDFFLACYTENPYLKNIIKTKLMREYFN